MKHTASKTIEIKINGIGRYYFPDDQTLIGKVISTLVPVPVAAMNYQNENVISEVQMQSMFISLTSDSVYYFFKDITLSDLSKTVKQGIYEPIEQKLAINYCYVEVKENITGVLVLTCFFEDYQFSNPTKIINSDYDSFEVKINSLVEHSAFPDNRNMVNKRFRNFMVTFPTITPLGNTGISDHILTTGRVSFLKGTQIVHDRLPLYLIDQQDVYSQFEFNNIEFDFESSFVENASDNVIVDGTYLLITCKFERD